MWEWLTSLFFASAIPAIVPHFHAVNDLHQMRLAYSQDVMICVCVPYEERPFDADCPEVPEGATYISATDKRGRTQNTLLLNETKIDERSVRLLFRPQCLEKKASEFLIMTLLSSSGYPTSSGTAHVDMR